MENRRKQRGSVTVLAIVAMLVLGTIIAGLLPMATIKHGAGNADRDTMAARYAAEAGLKRAYIALASHSENWLWLSTPTIIQNIPLADGSNATYSVSITGRTFVLTQGSIPPDDIYTVKSVGLVNGQYRQEITGKLTVDGIGVTFDNDDTIYGPPKPPGDGTTVFLPTPTSPEQYTQYTNATKYGILSGGTLTVYSGNYDNPTYGSDYALATTAGTTGFQWGPDVTTSVTQVLLDMFDAAFFNPTSSRLELFTKHAVNETVNPGVQGLSWNNVWATPTFPTGKQMYEVSGNVTLNCGTLTTGAFPSQVVIYSHGDITVNCRLQGNFILIADGKVTLNTGQNDTGQIELYSQGDMTVNDKIGTDELTPAYGVFMTRGNLIVHGNYYNKVFMFGRTSVRYDGGGTLIGAVYSLGNVTIYSSTNFTYDPSVIP